MILQAPLSIEETTALAANSACSPVPVAGSASDKDGGVLKCDLCQGQTYCAQFCSTGAIAYVTHDQASEQCRRKTAAALVRGDAAHDEKGT